MNRERLLRKLLQGSLNNVSFTDFADLVEGFGFDLDRIEGSHHIYRHPVIQPVRNEAKPYQIRQFQRIVEQYQLRLEGDK